MKIPDYIFRYTNGKEKPENPLSSESITPGNYSLCMVFDGALDLDWKINLDQAISETYFDIESNAGQDDSIEGRLHGNYFAFLLQKCTKMYKVL